jgi:hypothetical protein
MPTKQEDFYKDLDRDKKRTREKTLSFWTLSIFFLVIIIVGEIVLFTLGRGIRTQPEGNFSVKGLTEGLNLSSTKEAGDQSETIISQGTLCKQMIDKLNGDISCTISQDGIIIFGKFSPVLPKNSSVYLVPSIQDERIKFDITKVTIGNIGISKLFAAPVSTLITSATNASLPANSRVVRVDLQEAVMIVWTASKQE